MSVTTKGRSVLVQLGSTTVRMRPSQALVFCSKIVTAALDATPELETPDLAMQVTQHLEALERVLPDLIEQVHRD